MNFTREPIIETVITPRDGCKLVVRNSKAPGQEEYIVEAVEVVSFGQSIFFRSLERPRSFLVPVSDYEVLELKETRMALKSVPTERSIKIGGGREAGPPRQREQEMREEGYAQPQQDRQSKRDKRRRGRRGRDRHEPHSQEMRPMPSDDYAPPSDVPEAPPQMPEEPKPSYISKLFPPPSTLIKETLSRYKPTEPSSEEVFSSSDEEKDSPKDAQVDADEED